MRTILMTWMILLASSTAMAEHAEFDAVLQVPFHADASGRRLITMRFTMPDGAPQRLHWWLTLLPRHDETPVRSWQGEHVLGAGLGELQLPWRSDVPRAIYRMRLRARLGDSAEIVQEWPVSASTAARPEARPKARLAPEHIPAGPAQAAGYDVYLGNLHSQTNHSDGGGALNQCDGALAPQAGAFGPTDAYAYADQHGLDFLMTSEHNHMYDGSDHTAPDADAGAARALFHDGLRQATDWNASPHRLLALYGQEWGTISQGGHLNILNADALLGWERNAQGQLLANEETPKNDYAKLYRLMRARGWFGQFNHPRHDQFTVDGAALGWHADGDASMLLCEIMNSSAYSSNTTETETRRSNFESSCNALLEAGYHLAFSSNQDNHCANWGAADTNRTAVLLPRDTPLTAASLLQALRARRVYATMDKHAQLVFTANGHLMGERIVNRGKLRLQLQYASATGRSVAAVAILQGVPGRKGKVAALATRPSHTSTPLPGEHFYYARVTQDDGKILWSAPIWVTQLAR